MAASSPSPRLSQTVAPVPYVPSPDMPGDIYFERIIADNTPLGIKFSRVEITTVVPGSWAHTNGIELDDEILAIGGQEFRPLTPQERIAAFKQPRPLTIKFKRPEIKDSYYTLMLDEVKVGMGFTGARVTSISEGGWASRAGVKLHDEIIELSGSSFFELSDREKIEKLKEPRPILLKFKRPGRVMRAEYVGSGEKSSVPGMSDEEAARKLAEVKRMNNRGAGGGGMDQRPVMMGSDGKRGGEKSGGLFACCCGPALDGQDDVVVAR